jgi:hypothetical protein
VRGSPGLPRLAQLGRLDEARQAIQPGLALAPGFTIARYRAGVQTDTSSVASPVQINSCKCSTAGRSREIERCHCSSIDRPANLGRRVASARFPSDEMICHRW